MNHKFISYKLAKLAKDKGFDDECFGYYENNSQTKEIKLIIYASNLELTEEQKKRPALYTISNKNSKLPQWAVAAPTFQDIEEWLLNTHDLHIEICQVFTVKEKLEYFWGLCKNIIFLKEYSVLYTTRDMCRDESIKFALKLIK